MRYLCPKCGDIVVPKPVTGTCPICDSALISEPEANEAEPHGESEGLPSPKRRL